MSVTEKIHLANNHIKATFNLQGAELSSAQYNGKE